MREADSEEEMIQMQQLRSKASEHFLRKEWKESIQAYTQYISFCQQQISIITQNPNPDHLSKLQKSLCLAFSNRAEAQFRLRCFARALKDCDEALKVDNSHLKTLICKGKILLDLNRYNAALNCFKIALLDPQANSNSEIINGYYQKCKKLDFLSRSGAFDISDWVINKFAGKPQELSEYVGAVEIKKSEISGRGLFATKNIDSGTLLFVTRAVATERVILPESDENTQLVMWKSFIDKVVESATKCNRIHSLICKLSTGEHEEDLEIPDIALFRPEAEESNFSNEDLNMSNMVSILDVNSLVEESICDKVWGKNGDHRGVGLWLLSSFINHSCSPNSKRFHIGDHVLIHASRDFKAGEEITLPYFDVLSPLSTRRKMATNWGFSCKCKRCKFEEGASFKQEIREIEIGIEKGLDFGGVVYKLEEGMKKWMVKGKGKGYLRASFWVAYSKVFESEKLKVRWGRRIPPVDVVVDSVVDTLGSDERVLKVFMEGIKKTGDGSGGSMAEMEKAIKLGRGVYGKVMKKQALKTLLEFGNQEQS